MSTRGRRGSEEADEEHQTSLPPVTVYDLPVPLQEDVLRPHDIERFTSVIEHGVITSLDEDDRIDSFVIAVIIVREDEDGDEVEEIAVWSESRRGYVKLGILQSAVQSVTPTPDDPEA